MRHIPKFTNRFLYNKHFFNKRLSTKSLINKSLANKPLSNKHYLNKRFLINRCLNGSVILSCCLLLTSCATLSKEECLMGNWQAIGYNDGVAGRYPNHLARHSKACAKVSVSPNYQAWEKGRQQGLKQYCTNNNAYQLGTRGTTINAVCPASTAEQLQRINAQGLEKYNLNRQINEDKKQLEHYQEQYKKLIDGDKLDFKTEKEARLYLISLPDKMNQLKQRIKDNQWQIDALNRKYLY